MSLQIEDLGKSMAKLTVEESEGELEKAIQKAYLKNKDKINVPGFRKGKVPRMMIERMYGVEIFYEDAANEIIPKAYEKALEECELNIVSQPKIDVVQIEKGKPFIFTAEVAIKPEVTLGEYKGIEVEKVKVEVAEEEILAEIEKERENNARMITIEDRPVEDGDMLVIDFEGYVDGEAFDGGAGEDYPLTIGSHSFIDTFEEQLIGMSIGEEKIVNVTFPEEYQEKSLAGKAAEFKAKVKEIKKKELPELDDEFAKDVSEFDSLKEYKEDIEKNILEKKEQEAETQKEDAVVDKIIENATMEIAEPMIETQTRSMAEDFARRIEQQGMKLDYYLQAAGLTLDQLFEQMRPQAMKRIQTRLVLEKIVEVENIEAVDEAVDKEIEDMAQMYQMDIEKLKELISENEKSQIRLDLAVAEAIKLVAKEAKEIE